MLAQSPDQSARRRTREMLRDATRVTFAAVPLHQGGVSDKAQPDSSLPHLIHERRSAMNGIALGTSVKHGVESHVFKLMPLCFISS